MPTLPTLPTMEHVYYALAVAAQLYFFSKWVLNSIENYREMQRNYAVMQTFMHQIKTNHLKHIYRNLHAICDKLGIEFQEPEPEEE